ncbi:MAG: HAMP domain-containing sensor histidine kinase [Pseudomonadota bacterium]
MTGRAKWRPPLWLVLSGALFVPLVLSFGILWAMNRVGRGIVSNEPALLGLVAIVAATVFLGWLLLRLILGPVTALARYATAVRAGQQDAEVPAHYGTPELRGLGVAVLDMTEALQRREATIRAFADHATHELKTPVTTIRATAELLSEADGLATGDRALVERIGTACAQMEGQLAALRRVALAREPVHHGQTSLNAVAPRLQVDGLTIAVMSGHDVPLPLADEGLRVVLQEIARNAAQHGATRLDLAVDGDGTLTARDNGPGVSPGHADRIFDPFFTSRRESGGSGMGLAIAAALLSAHGGTIRLLESKAGAAFEIAFGSAA